MTRLQILRWGALLAPAVVDRHAPLLRLGLGPGDLMRVWRGGAPVMIAAAMPVANQAESPSARAMIVAEAEDDILGLQARLAARGVPSICPALIWAQMGNAGGPWGGGLRGADRDAWQRMLRRACCAVWVPDLPGWSADRQVWDDVQAALVEQVPVWLQAAAPEAAP